MQEKGGKRGLPAGKPEQENRLRASPGKKERGRNKRSWVSLAVERGGYVRLHVCREKKQGKLSSRDLRGQRGGGGKRRGTKIVYAIQKRGKGGEN